MRSSRAVRLIRKADEAHVDPSAPSSSGAPLLLHISGRPSCRNIALESQAQTSDLDSRMIPLVVIACGSPQHKGEKHDTRSGDVKARDRDRQKAKHEEGHAGRSGGMEIAGRAVAQFVVVTSRPILAHAR